MARANALFKRDALRVLRERAVPAWRAPAHLRHHPSYRMKRERVWNGPRCRQPCILIQPTSDQLNICAQALPIAAASPQSVRKESCMHCRAPGRSSLTDKIRIPSRRGWRFICIG